MCSVKVHHYVRQIHRVRTDNVLQNKRRNGDSSGWTEAIRTDTGLPQKPIQVGRGLTLNVGGS